MKERKRQRPKGGSESNLGASEEALFFSQGQEL